MENDRPIFVVGCPRSGTTMLQLMLHAHPRIAIPPETRFLLEGYRIRHEFGDLSQVDNRRKLADWIVHRKRSRFIDLDLDADTLFDEIVTGPGTLGSAVGTVFRAYAARHGKPRWGDKRPAYIDNLDVILRLFPNAQIISIIRDGRDCVASLKEMTWHRNGVLGAVSVWARAVDRADDAARTLGPHTYHQLRYEDLVRDPAAELRAICHFLGEDFDPAMLAPAQIAKVAVPKAKTWHVRTHGDVNTDRVQRWRRSLSPSELGLCETVLGGRLAAHGYRPAEVALTRAPDLAQLIRYGKVAARHDLSRLRRLALLELERLRPGAPIASQLDLVPVTVPRPASGQHVTVGAVTGSDQTAGR